MHFTQTEIDLNIIPIIATINIPPASTASGENNLGIDSESMTKAMKITKTEIKMKILT